MATTTNYGWTTPDDTALVKDGAAAIRTLGSSVDTTTKNLNPSTTLGDIEYRSSTANTNTRLGIGTTGQVLTVAGGVPSWSASGGMTLIQEQVASANTSMDFTSISGSYKQLILIWCGIHHNAVGSEFSVRFNSDSASNYINQGMRITGASTAQNDYFDSTECFYALFGDDVVSTTPQDTVSGTLIIDNYASTTKKKFVSQSVRFNQNGTLQSAEFRGFYENTAAITSINIYRSGGSGNFSNLTDTSIRLYGLAQGKK